VDLSTYRAWAERSVVTLDAGETLSLTVKALVTNSGNSAFGQTSQVEFVNITGGAYEVLGRADLPPFTGCGTMREVSVLWPDVGPGLYRILVSIDPDNVAPNEASEGNNEMVISVLVGTHGVFLPLV
jgi:hypothetical protein